MLKMMLFLLAVTPTQAQQSCDDADVAIKSQSARLDQERASVASYQLQAATLKTRYDSLVNAGKMDAFDRSAYLTSFQGPLFSATFCCANAADGLNGTKDIIGASPQLLIAKGSLKAGGWDCAFKDANTASGWADYARQQLDKAASLHAAIDAELIRADAILTKNGG